MPRKDIEVPARYYLRLIDMLRNGGLDPAPLLAKARIQIKSLERPDALLRHSQVEQFITQVVAQSGRTDLGFELGRTLTMSTHSIVGFGMLSSPTVERSLQFVARFFRLVMPSFGMRYQRTADGAEVRFFPVIGMNRECLGFHLEAIATAACREVGEMCAQMPRYEISVSIPEPPHVRRYRDMADVRWQFNPELAPGIHMHFPYPPSDYPIAMADPNALAMAEERCRLLLKSVAAQGSFSDWVRMMLQEAGDGLPTLGDLAALLNLSPRTLDRYLKEEGTGFRALHAQIQHQLACEHLRDGRLSITEIAYRLGFSDPANFTRAFRNQAGCSPREFQAKREP